MPEQEDIIAQGQRSIGVGGQATGNKIYSGDITNNSLTIERNALGSAIISGDGNSIVIYHYQIEGQVKEEQPEIFTKIGSNPYKGLLAFHEEDENHYFGREEQIDKLWNQFRDLHQGVAQGKESLRLLTILGASGSGKSSLARAGLLPKLARQPLLTWTQARVVVLMPGTRPIEALAGVLARVATHDQTPVKKTGEFAEELKKKNEKGEYDGLRRIADLLPEIATSPLVVLVDQFEEVYSLCKDDTERKIFIDNLVCAVGDHSARVSVLITLRSDFLGEAQRHPMLNQVIAQQNFIVPAMSKDELRWAIAKPAELAGHPLDEATVDLLIEQTEGREGALPLLQYALKRIWEGLDKGVEPAKMLAQIGGVGGALADEAQRIFDNLESEEDKKIAQRVFLCLVQLGDGTQDTRRRTQINQMMSSKDDQERVKKVIDRFAQPHVRLITLSSSLGTDTAEVTHEALFKHWLQFQEWLRSGRDALRNKWNIEADAKQWNNAINLSQDGLLGRQRGQGRCILLSYMSRFKVAWANNRKSRGYLLPRGKLTETRHYLQEYPEIYSLSPLAEDFVNKSINYRRINRLKTICGVATAFALVFGFACIQWNQNQEAQSKNLAASSKELFASDQQLEALIKGIEAWKKMKEVVWAEANTTHQVVSALQQVVVDWVREYSRLEKHSDAVNSVSFSPDGKTLASASTDKTIKLWNVVDGKELRTLVGHSDAVNSVSFSPDGKTLASASADKTIKLWNVVDGKELRTLIGHSDAVNSVSFSPDGKTLASASADKTIKLWNVVDGKELMTLEGHSATVRSVSFSPDGKTLASASWDRTIKLWNVVDGKELRTLKGHSDEVRSISFSPDGKTLASASQDQTVLLWNLEPLLKLDVLLRHGCNWVDNYLKTNSNVKEEERHLCDDMEADRS